MDARRFHGNELTVCSVTLFVDHQANYVVPAAEVGAADVELRVARIPHPERNVLEITKNGQVFSLRRFGHPILQVSIARLSTKTRQRS